MQAYMHAGRRQVGSESVHIVIESFAVITLSDAKFQSSILHTVLQSTVYTGLLI